MANINKMDQIVVPAGSYIGFSDTPDDDSSIVKILTGTGAPGDNGEANGSVYFRQDAADSDTFLYVRRGGNWVAAVMS